MSKIPIILLAAGNSSRMGKPKQLLPWGEKSLIEHQAENLLTVGNSVFVVLGANAELIIPVIENLNVKVVVNSEWQTGMGSSIASGVSGMLKENHDADGVMIALLDQPFVSAEHYKKLLNAFEPDKQQIIVSVSRDGWKGVPVLFDSAYFDELINFSGEQGAKKIFSQYPDRIISIECNDILKDMDTPEQYSMLFKEYWQQNKPL